ncbi:hypothetical protein JYU34_014576, partial [Plutella xylostella]
APGSSGASELLMRGVEPVSCLVQSAEVCSVDTRPPLRAHVASVPLAIAYRAYHPV